MPQTPTEKPFYVTTPIYYVNARPHIGHAYTTIVADVVARRHRLLGQPTFFLTGTDEHGQKIERSAAAAGIPPQRFADEVSASFRALWDRMGITYDDYIRTTEPRHAAGVQHLFAQLRSNDAIYKGTYTGQYCVSDEAYVDGPPGIHCPDCGRLTETVSEENYYFRLSRFQLPLLNLIESNTLRIEPDSRRNEVLSFLRGNTTPAASSRPEASEASRSGETPAVTPAQTADEATLPHTALGTPYVPGALKDLSISRTSFSWGIPVPGDEKHVIYVWLDALANYMTALGYGQPEHPLFDQFWPADLHLVGKEIIRFHCVYWPAFLLALDPNWAIHAPPVAAASPAAAVSPTASVSPAAAIPLLSSRSEAEESASATNAQASPSRTEASATSRSGEPPASASAEAPAAQPLGFDPAFAEKWLPKSVVAHGWLLFEESKMSKSRGNIVRTETILQAFGDQFLRGIEDHNAREAKKDPAFTPVPLPSERDRDLFATDVLRYFLLREIPFGQDGSFSFDSMVTRYNADLANGYGNLVSRVFSMIAKYFGSAVPSPNLPNDDVVGGQVFDQQPDGSWKPQAGPAYLPDAVTTAAPATQDFFNIPETSFTTQLESINAIIGSVDTLITKNAPWKLAAMEDDDSKRLLRVVLYCAAEFLRIVTALLHPFLPFSTARVWAQLGLGSIEDAATRGELRNLQWGGLVPGTQLGPLSPIFPRADKGLAQTMADLESSARPANLQNVVSDEHDATSTDQTAFSEAPLASAAAGTPDQLAAAEARSETASQAPGAGSPQTAEPAAGPRTSTLVEAEPILNVAGSAATTTASPAPATTTHVDAEPSGIFASSSATKPVSAGPDDGSPEITIDDFAKVELRIAQVLSAERIPKADKLLLLEIDLGYERRQILSGLAEWYTPAELVGLRIIVIANLAPRKMRGLTSHGMLLAASGPADGPGSRPILATVPEPIPVGTRLK